jgi:hypothetical protein
MVPPPSGGYGSMLPLPRRGGGGVERGGDACIALGGAVFAFHPRLVVEPGTNSDWTFFVFCGVLIYTYRY